MDKQARATIILAAATLAAARLAKLGEITSVEKTVDEVRIMLKYMVKQGLAPESIEKSS